jgi:hypothetical protein
VKHLFCILLATTIFFDSQSQNLIPFRKNKLWGYKDENGNVKITPQYQYGNKFILGIAVVASNDSVGAIDTNNNIIIPFKYHYLRLIDTSEFLFGYKAHYFGDYHLGVMTKDQKVKIAPEYDGISKRKGCYIVNKKEDSVMRKDPDGDIFTSKFFYGLVGNDGKVLIPCIYSYMSWKNDSLLVASKGETQALFNKKGEQLTGFEYRVFGDFIEGLAKARIGDKFGFIYPGGRVAIPVRFDYCEDFNNGYAIIKDKENWGAINKEGKIIIEPIYQYDKVKSILKEKYGSFRDELNPKKSYPQL